MESIFSYQFFQNALIASLLTAVVCGVVGAYIVVRRIVFISGGITHASFGGIGLGLYLGINPILSAAGAAVLAAFSIGRMSRSEGIREDSAIDSWLYDEPAILPLWQYPLGHLGGSRLAGGTCPPAGSALHRGLSYDPLPILR